MRPPESHQRARDSASHEPVQSANCLSATVSPPAAATLTVQRPPGRTWIHLGHALTRADHGGEGKRNPGPPGVGYIGILPGLKQYLPLLLRAIKDTGHMQTEDHKGRDGQSTGAYHLLGL